MARSFVFKDDFCPFLLSQGPLDEISPILWAHPTFWTKAFLATCHKALLREIGYICCEDWEDPANEAICRGDVDSDFCHIYNGTNKPLHTVVEEPMTVCRMHIFREIVKLRNGKIAHKNCGMIARLMTHCLWDVSNGQIYWPCALISLKN